MGGGGGRDVNARASDTDSLSKRERGETIITKKKKKKKKKKRRRRRKDEKGKPERRANFHRRFTAALLVSAHSPFIFVRFYHSTQCRISITSCSITTDIKTNYDD